MFSLPPVTNDISSLFHFWTAPQNFSFPELTEVSESLSVVLDQAVEVIQWTMILYVWETLIPILTAGSNSVFTVIDFATNLANSALRFLSSISSYLPSVVQYSSIY